MESQSSTDVAMDTAKEAKETYLMQALEGYPIMMLFKRLIVNENKENTVLTNSQIIDILEKEFHINTQDAHELELDIYLSVMKKYLKEWPQWDDFDRDINELKQKNVVQQIEKMLLEKYQQLKSYLTGILEIAMPLSKDKVEEVEKKFNKMQENQQKSSPEDDLSDVILEIHCSRPQLNNLIYRHPHPEQNYTIFNPAECGPSKISLDTPDYYAILNWWNVNIIFKMNQVNFVRSNVHEVTHTLVNRKLKIKDRVSKLKSGYQVKTCTGKPSFNKNIFILVLKTVYDNMQDPAYKQILEVIYSIIEEDLSGIQKLLEDAASYRKYFSKYPYVRYLSTDVPGFENDQKAMNYDLYLKEVISPMFQYDFIKEPVHDPRHITGPGDLQGIQLECKSCTMKFLGPSMLELLKQHILENHMNEPDWHCGKCKESFTMVYLTKNRWTHECKAKEK